MSEKSDTPMQDLLRAGGATVPSNTIGIGTLATHGAVAAGFLTVPQSRARLAVRVSGEKTAELNIGISAMLFAKGQLVAISTGQVVYFHTKPGAEQRAANAWLDSQPHVRCSAAQFDFIAGQTLTTAGLPLTKEI